MVAGSQIDDEDYLTEFVNASKYKVNFWSLYGVGYISKARITLQAGYATKIEVLHMEQ